MVKFIIQSILNNKNILKESLVVKGVIVLAVIKPPVTSRQKWLVWIEEKQLVGDRLSEELI